MARRGAGHGKCQANGLAFLVRSPDRIRTGVTALRGRRPRPLDDGAVLCEPCGTGVASAVQTTVSPPVRPTGGRAVMLRHEQARTFVASALAPSPGSQAAGVPGLEPRLTGPEPVGLPITPYPNGIGPAGPDPPTQSSGLRSRQPTGHGQPDTGSRTSHGRPVSARPASRSRRSHLVMPAERRNGTSWLATRIAPR